MARKLSILFYEIFKIALFVVGGGYAIIAVADEVFAKKLKWTEEGELVGQLPLFQMIPGIMAGHAAVYVGRKAAGWVGSLVALVAVALPSILIFSAVSMGYDVIPLGNRFLGAAFLGLRASLTGIIFAMLVRGWKSAVVGWHGYALLIASTAALFSGVHVMVVVGCAAVIGLAYALDKRAADKKFLSSPLAPLLFLQYGLVAFGGGYVLVPLYLQDFVGPAAPYLQLPSEEFANLMALTQMTPGPIGINAATFFGYKLFGFGGAVVTSLCLLVPGFVILSLALFSLEKFRENVYVKSVLAAVSPVTRAMMIVAFWSFAGMSLWTKTCCEVNFHPFAWLLAFGTVALMLSRRAGVVRLIFLSAALSVAAECARVFLK